MMFHTHPELLAHRSTHRTLREHKDSTGKIIVDFLTHSYSGRLLIGGGDVVKSVIESIDVGLKIL